MSEPRPPAPLRNLFEERLPEEALHRLWLGIARRRPERSRSRPLLLVACIAALLCTLLGGGAYLSLRASPLRLANREKIPAVLAAQAARVVAFDDGSQVELGAETRLDVLQSTDRAFVMALRAGRARFNVVPGGPRAWRVECGPLSVDVVGTTFLVERGPASVRVEVDQGRVLVSGQGVPDRVARLGASEYLVVPIEAAVQARSAASALGMVPPSRAADEAVTRGAPVTHESKEPAQAGGRRQPGAGEALRSASPTSGPTADAVDVLLQQADVTRREGEPGRAAALLQQLLAEHPRDSRVALAHFTLGRLYLDSLGQPQRAGVHFARAIESGLPSALAEDAQARLVQALASAGDSNGAESAAARYRARYPSGRHLQDVERWAEAAIRQ